MSKLDQSMDRFFQALDSLENAVNRRRIQAQSMTTLERELSALREDRAQLAEELDRMKTHNKELATVTDEVGVRLDEAIGDIQGVLNE